MRENGPPWPRAVLLAAGVKLAYSRAGPDDLRWMTGPTQALVGLVSGIDFTYETGYGYVSLAHRLVIAKSCTGVNYLLAVFGLLTFTLVPAVSRQRTKLLLVGALAGCAYGVTVVVNSVRIALAVALHEGGFAWGWLSAGRVHRLAGIVVYFVSLVGVHAAGAARGAAVARRCPRHLTPPDRAAPVVRPRGDRLAAPERRLRREAASLRRALRVDRGRHRHAAALGSVQAERSATRSRVRFPGCRRRRSRSRLGCRREVHVARSSLRARPDAGRRS